MAENRVLRLAMGSTIGRQAAENQDALGVDGWLLHADTTAVLAVELDASLPHAIVVTDGMGGNPGGRKAAELVSARVSRVPDDLRDAPDAVAALERAVIDGRALLDGVAAAEPAFSRLGTTLVALLWQPDGVILVSQIGDSMAYRFLDEYLGALGEPQRTAEGPGAGRLTDYLSAGQQFRPVPEPIAIRGHDGARFVLCTDGVWELASRSEQSEKALEDALKLADPRQAVVATLDLVDRLGADDNATVAILQVGGQ